ncbi:PorT family protein [Hymenobacter sp. BT635]|uniref:PorT family protein n=1 Tax=Hymenobacter nitidus TaxID=2880929 RepID=A0ABS8AAD0_9BACT|nr:porin family protein [Hymenobacter nitidus]MCB2375999.1 PorT family protein [Hymenobacter nitidus]
MKKQLQHGLLAAALMVAGATSAQAQVTFGPRVGLNVANIATDLPGSIEIDTKTIFAPQVGLTLNAQFGNLSVQPSLLFSQKGYKLEEEEDDYSFKATTRLSYAEIPVNLVYTTGGTEGFQVFAGPYVGFGIGGKSKFEEDDNGEKSSGEADIKFASKEGDAEKTEYVRALDFGLNAGVGYKAGPIQAQLGYGLGLSNLVPNDEDDKDPEFEFKNRVFTLSISYFFGE